MRCQSKVNCNSQVCWRQGNLQELWLQKEEEDDGFDGCLGCENDKIWKQSLFVQKKTCQSQRCSVTSLQKQNNHTIFQCLCYKYNDNIHMTFKQYCNYTACMLIDK